MRYVAILDQGRAWKEGETISGQDRGVMLAHLRTMRERYDEGSVLFGGPFRSIDGGIVLLEAPDRLAAKSVMDADPAVAAGILDYNLFEVRVFFDAVAGEAWSPA